MIITIIILVILILMFIGCVIFIEICNKEDQNKLKGGFPTDPDFGSAVWNELYFSVPKEKNKKILNFLKDGVISVNKEKKITDIKNFKEFDLHKNNLNYFDKNNYKIHHYRIIFYDEIIHTKEEVDIPIAISKIPFIAEGIEKVDKSELRNYYDDKLINKLIKSPIYQKHNDKNITYRQLRYEQVINAVFEYWFHICQYKYYYLTNHKDDINNSNLVSDSSFDEIDNEDILKIKARKAINEKTIKDNYEFLIYNNKLILFDEKSDIEELTKKDKYELPFKKIPYNWTYEDIIYICELYILYLQLTFGDIFKYNDAKVKINNKYVNIDFIKNIVLKDNFKKCLSKTGNIENLNYFEVLTDGDINFSNIKYCIEETIIDI